MIGDEDGDGVIETDTLGSEIKEKVVSSLPFSLDAGRDLSPQRLGMEEDDEEETSPSQSWFSACPPLDALEKGGRKVYDRWTKVSLKR